MSKETASLFLDLSEWLLLGSGAVLCFGIVGEYRDGVWWTKRKKLWELLVILGVAFELLGDGGAFLFGNTLQRIEGTEIISLSTVANDAAGNAQTALADSKTAKSQAGDARDSANADAAAASRTQVMADAVKADLVLTGSRADLFKDPQVFTNLLKAAKPLAGQKVDVRFPAGIVNSEPQETASSLASILRSAGMKVSGPMISRQDAVTGIFVYITWRASAKTRENALRLAHALIEVPLVVRSTRFEAIDHGTITIPKPEPLGVMWDLKREAQAFTPENEPLPFDDENIVIEVCPHP